MGSLKMGWKSVHWIRLGRYVLAEFLVNGRGQVFLDLVTGIGDRIDAREARRNRGEDILTVVPGINIATVGENEARRLYAWLGERLGEEGQKGGAALTADEAEAVRYLLDRLLHLDAAIAPLRGARESGKAMTPEERGVVENLIQKLGEEG